MTPWEGEPSTIRLEPLFEFHMSGLGYLHPEWSHGVWKGELAVDGERWDLPVDTPLAPAARARPVDRAGDHVGRPRRAHGIGILEQLAIGRHTPTGLDGIFDGYGS